MNAVALSIVVPCYNEEAVLGELHRRVTAVCATLAAPYELLLVNDGSTDSTWPLMLTLVESDPSVRAVNLARNFGHQLALSAGLSVCRGRRVMVIDADLQDPPELLPQMMAAMDDGADVVYGRRTSRSSESWFKLATAKYFYRLLDRVTDTNIPRDTGDFRLISRRVVDIFNAMPERQRYVRGMIAWIGFKQVPVDYDRAERFAGQTKYPLRKMLRFAADAVTSFSTTPLKLSIYVGLAAAGLAVVVMVLSLICWATGLVLVMGWASLFSALSFFSAVQLFVLGIIGEYLARVVDQGRGRPLYVIDRIATGPVRNDEADPGAPDGVSLPAADHDARLAAASVRP